MFTTTRRLCLRWHASFFRVRFRLMLNLQCLHKKSFILRILRNKYNTTKYYGRNVKTPLQYSRSPATTKSRHLSGVKCQQVSWHPQYTRTLTAQISEHYRVIFVIVCIWIMRHNKNVIGIFNLYLILPGFINNIYD